MPKLKVSPCTVELLDGNEIVVDNTHLHSCEALLDYVCQHIGTSEHEYFGLRYIHLKDGKISWLDQNKPLQKQLKKASRRFKVGIQFFPDTIHSLQDEITRYQFVLQTRENLLTGLWSCSLPTQALLASYIVQAEFGEYDREKHGKNYLDGLTFAFCQSGDFLEKVSVFHKSHKNMTPSDADWLYMKTARKMVLYGMDVFDVTDAESNTMSLGVNVYGIHVLHMSTVFHSFLWAIVTKIHCHGKEILINIKISIKEQAESITVSFTCPSDLDAKRISKTCNLYKEFSLYGSAKKCVKKGQKHVCSHIATRVMSVDFKRVSSKQYLKRFQSGSSQQNPEEINNRNISSVRESTKVPTPIEKVLQNEIKPLEIEITPSNDEISHDDESSERTFDGSNFSPISSLNEPHDMDISVQIDDIVNDKLNDITEETSDVNSYCAVDGKVDGEIYINGDAVDGVVHGDVDDDAVVLEYVVANGSVVASNIEINDAGKMGNNPNEVNGIGKAENEDNVTEDLDIDTLVIEECDLGKLLSTADNKIESNSAGCNLNENEELDNSFELITTEFSIAVN